VDNSDLALNDRKTNETGSFGDKFVSFEHDLSHDLLNMKKDTLPNIARAIPVNACADM
jgi:hypothetical protein